MMSRLLGMAKSGTRWLFGDIGRIRHERWEIWVMRLCLAWLIFHMVRSRAPTNFSQPEPHGIARFVDLTFLSRQEAYTPLYWLLNAALVCYALGFAVGPCLGYILAFVVITNSLALSQGFVGHATQLAGLVLFSQFVATVWAFFRGRRGAMDRDGRRRYRDDLIMDWSRQGIAATYVVAGITKLINSNGAWIDRSIFFVLQVQKAQSEAFASFGTRANAASRMFLSALGDWPWFAAAFLSAGLLLELLAFLGAWNRSLALVFGLLLLGFHVAMGTLMYLPFNENRDFLMVFFVNPAWWAVLVARWGMSRMPRSRAAY